MKRTILMGMLALLPFFSQAQMRFGCISMTHALEAMPGYLESRQQLDRLRDQYEAELNRAQNEFNTKYEEFLEEQKGLAPNILQKRQMELQELIDKNVAFRNEAQRLLKQAREDALQPLNDKLKAAITAISRERGYAFVLNTDSDACPYIDTSLGEDITNLVQQYTER